MPGVCLRATEPARTCVALIRDMLLTLNGDKALLRAEPKERCMAHGCMRPSRMTLAGAGTIALAGIIAVLTLAPLPAGGPGGSDKVYHVLAFACLAFPLPLVRPRWTTWVILGVVAYGGAIELIQPSVGRQAEWADLLADGIGAVMGAVSGWALSRYASAPP